MARAQTATKATRTFYLDRDLLDWLKERGERLSRSANWQVNQILRDLKDAEQQEQAQ